MKTRILIEFIVEGPSLVTAISQAQAIERLTEYGSNYLTLSGLRGSPRIVRAEELQEPEPKA